MYPYVVVEFSGFSSNKSEMDRGEAEMLSHVKTNEVKGLLQGLEAGNIESGQNVRERERERVTFQNVSQLSYRFPICNY